MLGFFKRARGSASVKARLSSLRWLRLSIVAAAVLCSFPSTAAQSPEKVYRIGILTELAVTNFEEQWRNALRKRGYVEGQNVVLEIRAAREKYSSLPKLAAELVESNVDIILTASTPTAVEIGRASCRERRESW